MGYNLEKLRFVFEILAFRSKMRKHFVLRIIYSSKQLTIIQNLIKSDEWIEEEGNDIGEIINGIKSGII